MATPSKRSTSSKSTRKPPVKQQLEQEFGLTVTTDGQVVRIKEERKVLRALKTVGEEGKDLGEDIAEGTVKGAKVVGENALYYTIDVPTEAVKATGRGLKRLGRHMRESHEERVERKQERREARREARAQRKAEAEAKAEAIKEAVEEAS